MPITTEELDMAQFGRSVHKRPTGPTGLMICEVCGVLVGQLSQSCDCIKGDTGTRKLRKLTAKEWGYIQDEPPYPQDVKE